MTRHAIWMEITIIMNVCMRYEKLTLGSRANGSSRFRERSYELQLTDSRRSRPRRQNITIYFNAIPCSNLPNEKRRTVKYRYRY